MTKPTHDLTTVSFESLSDIQYNVALSKPDFNGPKFVYIAFSGDYRDGSEGKDDALFMLATIKAIKTAWFTTAIVLDFSALTYNWGDNMAWIYHGARFEGTTCSFPFAIIVSDQCKDALKTLDQESYDEHCVETYDAALTYIRREAPKFKQALAAWRAS